MPLNADSLNDLLPAMELIRSKVKEAIPGLTAVYDEYSYETAQKPIKDYAVLYFDLTPEPSTITTQRWTITCTIKLYLNRPQGVNVLHFKILKRSAVAKALTPEAIWYGIANDPTIEGGDFSTEEDDLVEKLLVVIIDFTVWLDIPYESN